MFAVAVPVSRGSTENSHYFECALPWFWFRTTHQTSVKGHAIKKRRKSCEINYRKPIFHRKWGEKWTCRKIATFLHACRDRGVRWKGELGEMVWDETERPSTTSFVLKCNVFCRKPSETSTIKGLHWCFTWETFYYKSIKCLEHEKWFFGLPYLRRIKFSRKRFKNGRKYWEKCETNFL